MRIILYAAVAVLLLGAVVRADELDCKGSITSVQGEGLVARTHRFEVENVTGADPVTVLEKCKSIAQERQNRAARLNPGGAFRNLSQVDLECREGARTFPLRRVIKTRE